MIEQECKTSHSTKLEPQVQQEALSPFTIKTEPVQPESNDSISPPHIKVKRENEDDREIRATNPQASINSDTTMWSFTGSPQLSHLVTKVKEENPSSLHCDDIEMQTKSNGVSSFDTTVENSTETHKVTDNTQCLVCGETFANIMQYTHHLNVHSQSHEQPAEIKNECTEQLYDCLNCLETFPKESDLAAHKINCSELYKCAKCGKKCSTENNLKMHIKYMCKSRMLDVYQKESFICRLCKKSFDSEYRLTLHVNAVHHKLKTFSCTLCDKSFAWKRRLTTHIEAVHLKSFSCTLCQKSFASKQSLAKHVNGHKLRRFSCTLCDKSFTQNAHLTTHVDTIHRKIKSFTCTLCDKSFRWKRYLTQHIKFAHEKLKSFNCTLCDKSFSEKGNLTKHIDSVHYKKKPFSCTLCDKSFASKQSMAVHIDIVHNKLKPFTCTLCEKSFASKQYLTVHPCNQNVGVL